MPRTTAPETGREPGREPGADAGGSAPAFARARTAEQKERRREAILEAAERLVAERGVLAITLADLADEVGLDRSNVVRHFGTREEIFLDLAARQVDEVAAEGVAALEALPDPAGAGEGGARPERVVDVVLGVLTGRPVFCELVAHAAGHLEHNVSVAAATRLKLGTGRAHAALTAAVGRATGLPPGAAEVFVSAVFLLVSSAWTAGRPSAVVQQVYAQHPELARSQGLMQGHVAAALTATLRGLGAATGESADPPE